MSFIDMPAPNYLNMRKYAVIEYRQEHKKTKTKTLESLFNQREKTEQTLEEMLTKDQSASTRNRSDHILQRLQLDRLHLCPQRCNLLLNALLRRSHLQLLGRRLIADPALLQIQVQAHPGLCPGDFFPQPLAQLLDLRDQALVVGVGQTKVILLQHLQLGL